MIRATLVTDGSSDRVLIPILEWIVSEVTETPAQIQWADLRGIRRRSSVLDERVLLALQLFPCTLLFIHRDAEGQPPDLRYGEIGQTVPGSQAHVAVVPVRMQEAWLLHDESSIRHAAGRPHGTDPLGLPRVVQLEACPDPKTILHHALVVASGAKGRHLRRFKPEQAAHRVAALVTDWAPLRALPAFARLEEDTKAALALLGVPLRQLG